MVENCLSLIVRPRDPTGKIRVSEKQGGLFITLTTSDVINVSGSVASAVTSLLFYPVKRDLTYVSGKRQTAADAGPSMETTLLSMLLPDTKAPSSPSSCHRPLDPFLISHGSGPGLATDPGPQVGLSAGGLASSCLSRS